MGEIHTEVDQANDLTINIAYGPISIDDIVATITAYLSGETTGKVLWNFMQADGAAIVSEDLIHLQDVVRRIAPTGKRRKVAIVVSRDLGFGLSRMAESRAEIAEINADYYITRRLEEALAWLEVPSD
jgi:hypothetical protein